MLLATLLACTCAPPPEPAPPPPPAPVPSTSSPAWSVETCAVSDLAVEVRNLQPNASGARILRKDADGDGTPDLFDLQLGPDRAAFQVRLSRSTRRVRVSWELAPEALFTRVPIPADLAPADRAMVEEVMWERRCDRADASLSALLDPDGVHWFDGPPVPPVDYTWVRQDEWVVYRGASVAVGGLSELGREGPLTLQGTDRGVLALRPGDHAWLFVSPRVAPATITGRLLGGGAVEVLYSVLGADSAGSPLTVRRDL